MDHERMRFRLAVVVASAVAAIGGSLLLIAHRSSEKVTTRGVTATLRVPGHPGGVAAGSNALWLALTGTRMPVGDRPLLRLDLASGTIERRILVGGQASYLAHVGNRLFASVEHVGGSGSGPSLIVALDWQSGRVLARRQFPGVVGPLADDGTDLWALQVAPAAQERLRSTIFDLATRNPMALFGSDQVIDQFPGRKIYVGKKEGNKLENITVFEMNDKSLPIRVTYARTGMLEADLANKQILMHLYGARYQERDQTDPSDLRKIRDGINAVEGTLPISLEELYEKEKKRPSRSALSIEQLLDQLKSEDRRERSASRTEINKRFSFPFACIAFAIIGVPLGVTAHRRETSIGFAMGLIIAVSYFLFVIIGDTLRGNPNVHPELLVWFPNVLFIVLGAFLFRRLARQ